MQKEKLLSLLIKKEVLTLNIQTEYLGKGTQLGLLFYAQFFSYFKLFFRLHSLFVH